MLTHISFRCAAMYSACADRSCGDPNCKNLIRDISYDNLDVSHEVIDVPSMDVNSDWKIAFGRKRWRNDNIQKQSVSRLVQITVRDSHDIRIFGRLSVPNFIFE